jgi:hypothetical protein
MVVLASIVATSVLVPVLVRLKEVGAPEPRVRAGATSE